MIRIVAATLLALTASAFADRGPLPAVELEIVGGDAVSHEVGEHVASWFGGTKLTVHELVALDPNAVLAKLGHPGVRVWIVLSDPKRVQIFFAVEDTETAAPRYLMTDVTLDDGLDELGLEQLGQIIFPSAHALWIGELESPRDEVARQLAETARATPASARPSDLRFSLGAEYQAMVQGAGLDQSVGGTATLVAKRLGIRARFAALLPHESSDAGVTVVFHGASIGAGAVLIHPIARRTHLLGELGVGVDVVTYRPTMLPDPVLPTSGGTDVQPIIYARAGAEIALAGFSLAIEAVANVHLRRTHYDIQLDGETRELVTPWLLQPGFAAALTW